MDSSGIMWSKSIYGKRENSNSIKADKLIKIHYKKALIKRLF